MADKYLTVSEVAQRLQVSTSTVRRAIKSNRLQVHKVGSQPQIRISEDQLADYLDATKSGSGPGGGAPERSLPDNSFVHHPLTDVGIYEGTTQDNSNWKVIHADAVSGLRSIEAGSVNCIVTSPPYYWQRDYEVEGQIGHEDSVNGYVTALRDVFREAFRVLRDDGVLLLNVGDTYYSAKGRPHGRDNKHRGRQLSRTQLRAVDGPGLGVPRKSLLGIPWRVALALQDDGWTLRSSIVWRRPAPMPEPTAHDRPWRTHEPVFLFSKQPHYWFNRNGLKGEEDIWHIAARAYNPGSHFAPFPLELAERCVTVGCPVGGTVLDPFVGSGTTMWAALNQGMSAVGIDLKFQYCRFVLDTLQHDYCAQRLPLETLCQPDAAES